MKLKIIPGLCSLLVVGLGQIVKGDTNKGILLLLGFYFVLPASLYASLLFNSSIFMLVSAIVIIMGIIFWIYSIVEAAIK